MRDPINRTACPTEARDPLHIVDISASNGRPSIGWFLDDRPGAASRARAIVPVLDADVTLFHRGAPLGLPGVREVRLSPVEGTAVALSDPTRAAVVGCDLGLALSTWAEQAAHPLLVVDGPVEVALLARCLGVPIVPMRRPGPTVGALTGAVNDVAAGWLAPFPAALESPAIPSEVRQRTVHAGLLSRFEGRRLSRRAARRRLDIPEDGRHVTVLLGSDGDNPSGRMLAQAAATASSWTMHVVGPCPDPVSPTDRFTLHGWTDEVFPTLRAADVVIAPASLSAVADAAAADTPLGVVPPDRPGGPAFADALEAAGAAVVLDDWPDPLAWPALLAELLGRSPKPLRRLIDGRAAQRAARWLEAWALSPPADPSQARAALGAEPRLDVREPVGQHTGGPVPPFAAAAER
ncbi:MAG: hypothetical protein JJT89_00585 [Nitriliruptoraceae bacterium]|nr:hypothetical protein [Nitriliruptoraceae bacterium]